MEAFPSVFVSHGSPMHAVQAAGASKAWRALAQRLGKPRAVLVASAHWETSVPMLTGNRQPETIHDFGGFPAELYEIHYGAPGAPDIAARAVALLKDAGIAAGIDGCRGIDHGVWVPLRWMYPDADVPIVELAVQTARGTAHHLELGRALAPLGAEGVLVLGSGHVTHNLRDFMAQRRGGEPLAYAREFSEWLHDRVGAGDTDAVLRYRELAPGATRAHPTDEHFLPFLVAWGAGGERAKSERIYAGFEGNALAMDAYLFHPAVD